MDVEQLERLEQLEGFERWQRSASKFCGCGCGRRLGMKLTGRRNRRGFKTRKGHDLSQRCWRALKNRNLAKSTTSDGQKL